MKAKIIKAAVTAGVICTGIITVRAFADSSAAFKPDGDFNAELRENTVVFPDDGKGGEDEQESDETDESLEWEKEKDSSEKLSPQDIPNTPYLFETDIPSDGEAEEVELSDGESEDAESESDGYSETDSYDLPITVVPPGRNSDSNDKLVINVSPSDGVSDQNSGEDENADVLGYSSPNNTSPSAGPHKPLKLPYNTEPKDKTKNETSSDPQITDTDVTDGDGADGTEDIPGDQPDQENPSQEELPEIKEPDPVLPDDFYKYDWIDPGEKPVFPSEGVEDDEPIILDDGALVVFTENLWDSDALPKIYQGQRITEETLLASSYFYLDCCGQRYRLTQFGENFKIVSAPEYADGDALKEADYLEDGFFGNEIEVTYAVRANSNSPWINITVKYQVYPYMVLLADVGNKSTMGIYYLDEASELSLIEKYDQIFDSEYSDWLDPQPLKETFLGWSEAPGGKYIGSSYSPKKTGRNTLYSLGMKTLDSEYEAYLLSNINLTTWSFEYVQTLTGYSGEASELTVPDGIQSVNFDVLYKFDKVYLPAQTETVNTTTLSVKEAYSVSGDNPSLSARDGILYDKSGEKLLGIPTDVTELTLSENVTEINIPAINSISSLTVSSEGLTVNGLINLKNADIYVPSAAYMSYLSQWTQTLEANGCRLISADGETPKITVKDHMMLSEDETVLYAILDDGSGTLVVPDTVTTVASGAVSGGGFSRIILPGSVTLIESGAFTGGSAEEIYLNGDSLPTVEDGAFDYGVKLYVAENLVSQAELSCPEAQVTGMCGGVTDADGYLYVQTSDGAVTLLRAAEDCTHFNGVLPDGTEVDAIGGWAFAECSGLELAELPERINYIGKYAFDGLSDFGFFSEAKGALTVANYAFENCEPRFAAFNSLEIYFEDGYTPYLNGVGYSPWSEEMNEYPYTFNNYGDEYYLVEQGSGKYLMGTLWDGYVQVLGSTTDVSGDITLGENVICINDYAFSECKGITSVYIDGSNMPYDIPEGAFEYCSSLAEVTFGENAAVTGFGSWSFIGTALKSITVPESVTAFLPNVFGECYSLEEIIFTSAAPPQLVTYSTGIGYMFGDDLAENPRAVLSGEAAGHEQDYIDEWKYPLIGSDKSFGELSADDELYAENLARELLGLDPIEALEEN